MLEEQHLERASDILKALANPVRLRILMVLEETHEAAVSQIVEATGSDQPLVSKHLSTMRLLGIVEVRRDGKNMFYSLKMKPVLQVLECVRSCV